MYNDFINLQGELFMDELKCPICGEPTYLVYGKNPRKDRLCAEHGTMANKGLIEQCPDCGKWHKTGENCECKQKKQIHKSTANIIENIKCPICGQNTNGKEVCKNCFREIMGKREEIDNNLNPWELKDYFYNLYYSIFRLKENEYAKAQVFKLYAIAWILRDLHKDTQLSDIVGLYSQRIIETRKTKPEYKITEEKARTDKDTVAIANPKNRASDGHICKSKGEVEIDNLLYKFQICHAYGLKVKEIPATQQTTVVADWYIPLSGTQGIYIEYWGMDKQDYQDRKKEKLELYEEYKDKIKLIQIEKNDINDPQNLEYNLYQQLISFGWKAKQE